MLINLKKEAWVGGVVSREASWIDFSNLIETRETLFDLTFIPVLIRGSQRP